MEIVRKCLQSLRLFRLMTALSVAFSFSVAGGQWRVRDGEVQGDAIYRQR